MKNIQNTIIQLVVAYGMIYSPALAADVSQKAQRVLCRHMAFAPVSQKSVPNVGLGNLDFVKHPSFPKIMIYSELDCQFSGNEKGLYNALSGVIKEDTTSLYVYVFPEVEVARSQLILKLDVMKRNSTDTRYAWFDGDTGKLMLLDPGIQDLGSAIEVGRQKVIASTQSNK